MSWRRKLPISAVALVGLGVVLAAEVGGVMHYRVAARRAGREVERSRREMRVLAAREPAASPENAALIAADVRRTSEALAAREKELFAAGKVANPLAQTPVPSRRPEAFFDIAAFVEALRTRAQQAGVTIKPDERFGFSAYSHEAPAAEQIADVFQERQLVQYLVETLIDTKPHELLSVQRERPRSETGASLAPGSAAGTVRRPAPAVVDADYFTIDPRISVREPAVMLTRAFRLSFTGHTATLRALLNKLGAFELPLVVRAVEVSPPETSGGKPPRGESTALVASWWSRFTVTVELLELPPAPSSAS